MAADLKTQATLPTASDWIIKPTADKVALLAKDIILKTAQQAIQQRGVFKIVLAGGTTPEKVYQLLTKEDCDWQHWQIYLGDERCLVADDAERNSQMLSRTLLRHIKIPKRNVYLINTEKGAKAASIDYAEVVKEAQPFDLVMLGMGEDGHTASLFPNHQHNRDEWVHTVSNAPKPPADRVSLSLHALSQTRVLLILITGASKKYSVDKWREGENIPVAHVGTLDKAHILLDYSASSRNDK